VAHILPHRLAEVSNGQQLWNRLIGLQNPERLGIADER
jgi:hypothetical protein